KNFSLGGRKMKNFFFTLFIIVLIATGCSNSDNEDSSDDFPNKPITVIVGYSAGGGSDTVVRLLKPYLEEELGTSITVENVPGAGGMIGATTLDREEADGYTLGNINQPALNFTIALEDTNYDQGDLIPLWAEVKDPNIWLTKKESSWDTIKDFIEDAKENPGEYKVGVVPSGGQQANALWLKDKFDLDFRTVNFDGGSDAGAALLGDQVDA